MNRNEQLDLAGKVANQFFSRVSAKVPYRTRRRLDMDDCRQEAFAAVLGCYGDVNMGNPAYLRRVVWNNLVVWLRREIKISDAETQFPLPQPEDDPADGCGSEVTDSRPFARPEDRAAMNELHSAVAELPEHQQYTVRGIMRGETIRQLAGGVGLSKSMTHRCQQAGLSNLRTYFGVA